jgi:hypothetical protein
LGRGGALAGEKSAAARLARRSAASRFSSACLLATAATSAARRSAEFGRRLAGCTDTVILFLAVMALTFLNSDRWCDRAFCKDGSSVAGTKLSVRVAVRRWPAVLCAKSLRTGGEISPSLHCTPSGGVFPDP